MTNDQDEKSNSQETGDKKRRLLREAVAKFRARPGTYLLIPVIASVVGWVTNWLAVQMIFYPIQFRGIRIYQPPEMPLGLIGWQGIIPCKTRTFSEATVQMVTTQLLTLKEAFARLDPTTVASIMSPVIPDIMQDLVQETVSTKGLGTWLINKLQQSGTALHSTFSFFGFFFLRELVRAFQWNVDTLFNVKNCVVNQMIQDKTILGNLLRQVAQKELDFLVNSGLWFGFLLGLIQMVVALFWTNPWALSIGGGIVGFATNWLALKWIFVPIDPTRIGPFTIQGMFLRRQKEVASAFSSFFAQKILTSEQIWTSVLTDPSTRPAFAQLFSQGFLKFFGKLLGLLPIYLVPSQVKAATERAMDRIPSRLPALYPYMDSALALEITMRTRMEQMSSRKFERVLHPIFEEDEFILILAGAVLGFLAGLIQQGLETGSLIAPDLLTPIRKGIVQFIKTPRRQLTAWRRGAQSWSRRMLSRIQQRIVAKNTESNRGENQDGENKERA